MQRPVGVLQLFISPGKPWAAAGVHRRYNVACGVGEGQEGGEMSERLLWPGYALLLISAAGPNTRPT